MYERIILLYVNGLIQVIFAARFIWRQNSNMTTPLLTGEALPGVGSPKSPVWILKRLVSVFINACRLMSALPSLSQFGWGRLSLVAISFYVLSLLFGSCRLSEFTLAGPHRGNFMRLLCSDVEKKMYNKVCCMCMSLLVLPRSNINILLFFCL